jgi:hypothetical protein
MALTPTVIPLQVAPPLVDVSLDIAQASIVTLGNQVSLQPFGPTLSRQTPPSFASTNAGTLNIAQDGTGNTVAAVQQTGAGVVNDVFCGYVCPDTTVKYANVSAIRPINARIFRAEFIARFAAAPTGAGMCNEDTGFFFFGAQGFASGRMYNENNANNSDQNAGFGLQVDRVSGKFKFLSKQLGGVGQPFAESTVLAAPANGFTAPFHIDMRIIQAVPGADAAIQIFLDSTLIVSRAWGAGTVLPQTAIGGLANGSSFQVGARNCNSVGNTNPDLWIYGFRVRYGSLLSVTLENDF